MSAPARKPVPWDLRLVAVLCTLMSAMVGFGASAEAMSTLKGASIDESHAIGGAAATEAYVHLQQVTAQAVEPMRPLRAVILFTLSVCAGITLIGGIRLVRPAGLPREGVRRLTAGAALFAAVLRTLDGAQQLALLKRTGPAQLELALKLFELPNTPGTQQGMLELALVATVALTFLFAGGFVGLWHYLGSQRVRDVVAQDA